jgi:type I restriction enzyme M protein
VGHYSPVVDIFEAEDVIDLNAIAAQLTELEQTSKTTDATIVAFCLELSIKPPFAVQGESA